MQASPEQGGYLALTFLSVSVILALCAQYAQMVVLSICRVFERQKLAVQTDKMQAFRSCCLQANSQSFLHGERSISCTKTLMGTGCWEWKPGRSRYQNFRLPNLGCDDEQLWRYLEWQQLWNTPTGPQADLRVRPDADRHVRNTCVVFGLQKSRSATGG